LWLSPPRSLHSVRFFNQRSSIINQQFPIHPAALDPDELLAQCAVRTQRASGPGGQHRNKVETAVVLTHTDSGVSAQASERRSQAQNKAVALFRLRVRLALEVRRPIGASGSGPTPSTRWAARVKGGRLSINPNHEDFPALLAEALDHLDADVYDIAISAKSLGISTSQLIKLLRHEPKALEQVNTYRKDQGLRGLS